MKAKEKNIVASASLDLASRRVVNVRYNYIV